MRYLIWDICSYIGWSMVSNDSGMIIIFDSFSTCYIFHFINNYFIAIDIKKIWPWFNSHFDRISTSVHDKIISLRHSLGRTIRKCGIRIAHIHAWIVLFTEFSLVSLCHFVIFHIFVTEVIELIFYIYRCVYLFLIRRKRTQQNIQRIPPPPWLSVKQSPTTYISFRICL